MSFSASAQLSAVRLAVQNMLPPAPLLRFARRRLCGSWFDRAVCWGCAGAVVAWGVFSLLVARPPRVITSHVTSDALVFASWTGGLFAALRAARPLVEEDARDGIPVMMALRGLDAKSLQRAYLMAAAERIARWVAGPAFAICMVALTFAGTPAYLLRFASTLAVVLVYATVFGATMAAAARWLAMWVPRRGPSLLLTLVALPSIASLAWPTVPDLPSLYRDLAAALLAVAGGLA